MAKRYTQPQGNAQIDWGNPITMGLLSAFVPTPNGMRDLLSSASISSSSISNIVTAKGVGSKSSPSAAYGVVGRFQSSVFTRVFVATPQTTGSGAISDSTLTQHNGAEIQITSSNVALNAANAVNYINFPISGTSPICCAVVCGSGRQIIFVNGVAGTPRSGSVSFFFDGTGVLLAGNLLGEKYDGVLLLHLDWNRALSDAEAVSISANPWQIFKGTTLILPAASVTLPTIGRPATDGPTGAWTATGGTGTLASAIGELTAIDTDYISVTSASTYTGTLNACAYPGGATQTVSFRGSSTTGSSVTLTFVQSGVTLLTWTQALTSTVTTYTHNLTTLTGDATAITFTIASS